MLIFKEVRVLKTNLEKLMQDLLERGETLDGLDLHVKLECLTSIVEYMESGEWLKRKDAVKKFRLYLEYDFNTEQLANYLGVDSRSVRASLSFMGTTFKEKIGVDTLELLKGGDVQTAYMQFRTRTGLVDLERIIPKPVLDLTGLTEFSAESVVTGVAMKNCVNELKFLKILTFKGLESKINALESKHFKFLGEVLNDSKGVYLKEKVLLLKYLEGVIDLTTLMDLIKNKDRLSL